MGYPPQGVGGAGGIRKLSELEIDTDKDWQGFRIRNIGAPLSDLDVPRARAEDILSGVFSLDRIPTITRAKLEYPTEDVSFAYLSSINKTSGGNHSPETSYGVVTATVDSFADKAVDAWIWDRYAGISGRYVNRQNSYLIQLISSHSTADFLIYKIYASTWYALAHEAVDITPTYAYLLRLFNFRLNTQGL
jgi:hypothetical protein